MSNQQKKSAQTKSSRNSYGLFGITAKIHTSCSLGQLMLWSDWGGLIPLNLSFQLSMRCAKISPH